MVFDSIRIIDIHSELLRRYSIEPGFRDKHAINSIIYKMNNKISGNEIYPDDYSKAASMFEGIIRFHPFIDGNKRTALASIQEYLLEKNIVFVIPLSAVRFAVKVAQENRLDQDIIENLITNISGWLKYRSASFNDARQLKKIYEYDIKLIKKIAKIAKERKDPEITSRTIDYWLAKDIYPDSDITLEQVLQFLGERGEYTMKFFKQKSKKMK
jgi:death-on-curing protein